MIVVPNYNRMLLNRTKLHIDAKLRINQNGFRKNSNRSHHSTDIDTAQAYDEIKKKNLPTVIKFVDFKTGL